MYKEYDPKLNIISAILKVEKFDIVRYGLVPIINGIKEYQAYSNGLTETYRKEYVVITNDYKLITVPTNKVYYYNGKVVDEIEEGSNIIYEDVLAIMCETERAFDGERIMFNNYLRLNV